MSIETLSRYKNALFAKELIDVDKCVNLKNQ